MTARLYTFLHDPDKRVLRFSIFCGAIYFTQATGATGGLAGNATHYFMKEGLGLTATTIALFVSLTTFAWWVKPCFGLISDFVPLFGYRRKSYIYLCNALSIILWLSLSGMSFAGLMTTFWPLAIVSFFMAFNFAMTDVVADGLMIETGKATDNTGKFQAVQWGTNGVAVLLTSVFGAMLAIWAMPDSGKPTFEVTPLVYRKMSVIFIVASVFPLINIFATYFLTIESKIKLDRQRYSEIKAGIFLAIKTKPLWYLAFCMFCLNFSPGWGTPFFYYLRDYGGKDGGQMGKMTLAYLGTSWSAFGIIGCIIYWRFCKTMNNRKLLYFSIIIGAVASCCCLWVSGVVSVLVVAVLFGPVTALINLVYLDILAKNCPDLAEGFIFATMCAVLNIDLSASNAVGGLMYGMLEQGGTWYTWGWSLTGWLTRFGVSENMVGLRPLIVISALFSLVTIFLIPFLKLDNKGIMRIG